MEDLNNEDSKAPAAPTEAPPVSQSEASPVTKDAVEPAITPAFPRPALVPAAEDPFDPLRLRLSQDFTTVGVKKLLTTVPVRKPSRQSFVRVRPGEDWRLETAVVELKEEGEVYLVDRSLWDELALEIVPKVLFVAIDRLGVLFLWPVNLPKSDGRQDAWSRSALVAAERAMTGWVRVVSNRGLGAYEIWEATANIPDPDWPDIDLRTILETAFRDRVVCSLDHPVVRRLRGES